MRFRGLTADGRRKPFGTRVRKILAIERFDVSYKKSDTLGLGLGGITGLAF